MVIKLACVYYKALMCHCGGGLITGLLLTPANTFKWTCVHNDNVVYFV